MSTSGWLLLVTNLPGANQALRMRIWRALRGAGAALLRDGVYLLPQGAVAEQVFAEQALVVRTGGGAAYVLAFASRTDAEQKRYVGHFDRSASYAELKLRLDGARKSLPRSGEATARRTLAVLRREVGSLVAIDFFPAAARSQVEQSLADLEAAVSSRFSPDEPQAVEALVLRRQRKLYRGRSWATRERLWIDRVCSAWLIQRFIDPRARFLWLKHPADCPKRAVGFDFDGAEFSHVGAKVTFETLLSSFELESDAALARLGALVHFLDVGGVPVAEAAGLAAIVSGARAATKSDDALLKAVCPVLDSLYANFSETSDTQAE